MLERTLTCTMGATAAIADMANMLLCRRRHGRARAGRLCVELGVRVARKPLRLFFLMLRLKVFCFFERKERFPFSVPRPNRAGLFGRLTKPLDADARRERFCHVSGHVFPPHPRGERCPLSLCLGIKFAPSLLAHRHRKEAMVQLIAERRMSDAATTTVVSARGTGSDTAMHRLPD